MAMQYIRDDTGTYIPATQRPDGSWRKARRVKDGYIPQDEMPLYESKGKQWAKNKPTLPIGLDPVYPPENSPSGPKTIPGLSTSHSLIPPVTSSKKKKKKKNDSASKQKEIAEALEKLDVSPPMIGEINSTLVSNNVKTSQPVATDPAKRLRNLRKKLKDINALKLKIDSGELTNPDKDQLEKVRRKEEIEAEIEELEFQLELA